MNNGKDFITELNEMIIGAYEELTTMQNKQLQKDKELIEQLEATIEKQNQKLQAIQSIIETK